MTVTHDLTARPADIHSLRPHPRNARNGDLEAIGESLRVNGQYRPIVAAHGVILAGNHTYMAAMELGWDTISVVDIDVDPDSAAARRIMLADNKTADLGSYDDGLLLDLLSDMEGDLTGTGYTDRDLLGLIPDEEPLDLGDVTPLPVIPLSLLVSRDTAEKWREHRAGFTSDTDALDALL